MAPGKKRLLKVFIVVYLALVAALLVHAFSGMKGTRRLYKMTPDLVGLELAEPLEVRSLDGLVLDAARAKAFNAADVATVRLADGRQVDTDAAVGEELGVMTLPAGTKITEELWTQVLAPESSARADEDLAVTGDGNIIGFSLNLAFTVMNFVGLLCILYVFVWDPVLEMLDKRADTIRGDIEDARRRREEAKGLRAKYAELMQGAKKEREELVAAGQRDGESERQKIIERARGEAEKIIQQARGEIGAEAERARKDLRREVGGLSAEIAAEILRRELRPEDHEALVQEFLKKVEAPAASNGEGA